MVQKLIQKPQQEKIKYRTVPTDDLQWAKKVVDDIFSPIVKKQLDHMNKYLYNQRKIRAGLELNWMFDQEGDNFHEAKEESNNK